MLALVEITSHLRGRTWVIHLVPFDLALPVFFLLLFSPPTFDLTSSMGEVEVHLFA